jgi:hypothetical protein
MQLVQVHPGQPRASNPVGIWPAIRLMLGGQRAPARAAVSRRTLKPHNLRRRSRKPCGAQVQQRHRLRAAVTSAQADEAEAVESRWGSQA